MSKNKKSIPGSPTDPVLDPKVNTEDVKPEASKNKIGDNTEDESLNVRSVKVPAQVFNTKKAATLSASPIVATAGGAMRAAIASGEVDRNSLSGDRSAHPYQGEPDFSAKRIDKKRDSEARELRTKVSEQVESDVLAPKPLSESKDEKMGATGLPYNKHFHSQKVHGCLPSDLNFDRSLDFISRDEALPTAGQYLKPTDTPLFDGVSVDSSGILAKGVDGTPDGGKAYVKGNYLNKTLTIKITPQGVVTTKYNTIDVTPQNLTFDELNRGAKHAICQANQNELDRQAMETLSSNEAAENFSPLSLAINNPTGMVSVFSSIENDLGSELLMAGEKVKLALSFIMNRTGKDGLKDNSFNELFLNATAARKDTSIKYEALSSDFWRTNEGFAAGSSGWMLGLLDTLLKNNYKSDIYLNPRGIKQYIDLYNQNVKPFKVRSLLPKLLKGREMFSLLNGEYDPFLPILFTDNEALFTSFSYSDFVDSNGVPISIKYVYNEKRNEYTTEVYHPLIKGIYDYLSYNWRKIRYLFETAGNANLSITVPIVHSMTGVSVWSLLCMAAMPEIVRCRMSSFRDVIKYEAMIGYPFSDFMNITEAIDLPYKNFDFQGYDKPLKAKQMDPVHAISWILPEMWYCIESIDETEASISKVGDPTIAYIAPWYLSVDQFNKDGSLKDGEYKMNFPLIRSGSTMKALEDLYSVKERDLRLSIDMVLRLPKQGTANFEVAAYKYSRVNDGGVIFTNEITNPEDADGSYLTVLDIITLPRELGLSIVMPANALSVARADADDVNITKYNAHDLAYAFYGETSYVARVYAQNINAAPAVLAADPLVIDPMAGLQQSWFTIPAINDPGDHGYKHGYVLSMNQLIKTYVDVNGLGKNIAHNALNSDHTEYTPVAPLDNSSITSNHLKKSRVISLQKYFWFRIQRLPMLISPWDVSMDVTAYGRGTLGANDNLARAYSDPYDLLYFFNLAGFMASDYEEDVYDRINNQVSRGMSFVSDPFIEETPLLK